MLPPALRGEALAAEAERFVPDIGGHRVVPTVQPAEQRDLTRDVS
jgi:hypothetical protein